MRNILLGAIAVLTLTGCAPADNTADPNIAATPPAASSPAAAPAKPKTTRVVTYSTPSGQEQNNGARVPWHKTFKVKKGSFAVLVVSAQNKGSGTITCEIDVDGKKVKASKSSGAYAIASCDHPLGF